MQGAKKIRLIVLAVAAVFQCGAGNGCVTQPVGAAFDYGALEAVLNQPRPASLAPGDPELPRIYLDTTYRQPTGKTISVAAGGNLQAALDQAQPGDVISLQAGATFRGNFVLPNKTGADWIVVRTSTPDAQLPQPGVRIAPTASSLLPKIVTPNTEPALRTAAAAHHFRFVGIEFGIASGAYVYNIVNFDAEQTSMAQMPHDLILDRCYVHGNVADTARRGVTLNCARAAIIDSYISEIHEDGADSQAIACWNGTGPFKIVNNHLEGAGENVLLGGAPPEIQGLIPSDIEFRQNLVFKPLTWQRGNPVYGGRHWTVKNLFEIKNGQRLLMDRNIFENNWADAQSGFAILFTPRSEAGDAPWATVQDVTFTNNIVRHVGSGVNIAGPDDVSPSLPSNRILIKNNLFDDIDGKKWGGVDVAADGRFVQFIGGPLNITIDHNTIFQDGALIVADVAPSPGLTFQNNIAPHNEYGVLGSGRSPGLETLNFYFPGYAFAKNVVVLAPSEIYPTGNFYPNSFENVGFVDRAGGNYRLSATSPFRNAGTDGKNIGCDFDALTGNTLSVVSISAANYRGSTLAVESIVAAFGSSLATGTQSALSTPLPTTLTGTTVRVRDRAGVERFAPLFFVSPTQVNYQIPPGTAAGPASITITSGNGTVSLGTTQIAAVAPGLFTVDSSGQGLPSANLLRIKAGGSAQFEQVARFDAGQNKWVAVPIDLGPATDQVFLVLYGTGIRFRSSMSAVVAVIGGTPASVPSADGLSNFVGLDQMNIQVPRTLAGRGDVDVALTVDGQPANIVRVNIK